MSTFAEETLALNDASKEDAVIALLEGLGFDNAIEFKVEIALDYPGQQLAVDLAAPTAEQLEAAIATIRDALKRQLDLDAPTCSSLEEQLAAKRANA